MPSLPIPVFGALVLMFLFVQLWVSRGKLTPLAILLAICGVQSLIIALAQHYLVPGMRMVQPITATLIPSCTWYVFQTSAVRGARRTDLLHALVPITALAALLVSPEFLDVFIPGVFVVYGAAILSTCLKGPDAQPRLYLQSAELPTRIWLVIGVALIVSAFSDILITGAMAAGFGAWKPWIVSIFSVGNLILIGMFGISRHLRTDDTGQEDAPSPPPDPDTAVWDAVQTHMGEHRPYLDPDLTLAKLARKLGIPAKTISTTINRATGQNVSRYVNDARIETAMILLKQGETVTNAMLSSGFNTKSNFNREFLRVTGTSPSKWLLEQA
ncbi:MAG: AraC family transcriptional regulator [Pseudomonadota bacterium]